MKTSRILPDNKGSTELWFVFWIVFAAIMFAVGLGPYLQKRQYSSREGKTITVESDILLVNSLVVGKNTDWREALREEKLKDSNVVAFSFKVAGHIVTRSISLSFEELSALKEYEKVALSVKFFPVNKSILIKVIGVEHYSKLDENGCAAFENINYDSRTAFNSK